MTGVRYTHGMRSRSANGSSAKKRSVLGWGSTRGVPSRLRRTRRDEKDVLHRGQGGGWGRAPAHERTHDTLQKKQRAKTERTEVDQSHVTNKQTTPRAAGGQLALVRAYLIARQLQPECASPNQKAESTTTPLTYQYECEHVGSSATSSGSGVS